MEDQGELGFGGDWSGMAEVYAATFARLCAGAADSLLAALGPPTAPAGSIRLLDVGTGPGTLARRAERLGYATHGVDPEPTMVDLAARRAEGVLFVSAGLPRLPYGDGAFDAVVANFVLNHVAEPRAGLEEMRRVCRPPGRVAVTIWAGEVSVMNQLWQDILAVPGVRLPPPVRLSVDQEFERTEVGLARLLTESGLAGVRSSRVSWTFSISPDALWLAVEAGLVTVGRAYLAQDRRVRALIRADYERRTPAMTDSGLLRLPTEALLAVGSA